MNTTQSPEYMQGIEPDYTFEAQQEEIEMLTNSEREEKSIITKLETKVLIQARVINAMAKERNELQESLTLALANQNNPTIQPITDQLLNEKE